MEEDRREELVWPPSVRAEMLRYALAFVVVSSVGALAAVATLNHRLSGPIASDEETAVLIDLAPAVASSAPQRDVVPGPEQQAQTAAAAAAPTAPREVKPVTRMPLPAKAEAETPSDAKPPDAMREPLKSEIVPTPVPAAAAAPARDERGASGAAASTNDDEASDPDTVRARATKAITVWQKSMLRRIETARSGMRTHGQYGSITIAFSIAPDGTLTSSGIERGSGSPRLDAAALELVRRAAPFSKPPSGVSGEQLTFKIPIVFARQK